MSCFPSFPASMCTTPTDLMHFWRAVWLKRAGAEIRPAVEVAEVAVDEKAGSFELLIACKHVADRGATLGGEFDLCALPLFLYNN